MKKEFIDAVHKRLSRLEGELSASLREEALTAGWPAEIADQLGIKMNRLNIALAYPPELEDEINDLEYGTPGNPPLPVTRFFLDKQESKLAAVVQEWYTDWLFETEVLP